MSPRRLRRRCRELCLAAALGALGGCAHVETRVVQLGPAAPQRPASADVRVERAPARYAQAREVALLEVTSFRNDETVEGLHPTLRELAREVGADTVVLLRSDRATGFLRVIASALRTR